MKHIFAIGPFGGNSDGRPWGLLDFRGLLGLLFFLVGVRCLLGLFRKDLYLKPAEISAELAKDPGNIRDDMKPWVFQG